MKCGLKTIIIIMAINSLFSSPCKCQEPDSTRPAAVAGEFYPSSKSELIAMLSKCFKAAAPYKPSAYKDIAGIIVPHAGYVFSGEVAASAYVQIDPQKKFEHIFIIGPGHRAYVDGASVNIDYEYYATPLGKVRVDTELGKKLISCNKYFTCKKEAHAKEHCIEVQLPFLQYHLKQDFTIVPIIIGSESLQVLMSIAESLLPYFNGKNLFVISSDFSHYPAYDDAKRIDGKTGKAVESGTLKKFIDVINSNAKEGIKNLATSACGECCIAVAMRMAECGEYSFNHIMYRNSGDSQYGGKDEVVGYHAFAIERTAGKSTSPEVTKKDETCFSLTDNEKQTLLKIARSAISSRLESSAADTIEPDELTPLLRSKCGAFVTLNESGTLRGCIGHFGSDMPLYIAVHEMAAAAAFEDPRFCPVEKQELPKIKIEISVLTPMRKIQDISELVLGRDGIYISKGSRGGTFLPQVATETGWTKEEFLGHCSQEKAGLGWDGWKTAELYTYQALVFEEGE